MRILVFSRAHSQLPWMSSFPHVRGHVLAKYLRRLGADAEFRTLPVAGAYDVAICSDYQGDATWLTKLQRHMTALSARRMFCMADRGGTDRHFSQPMAAWFAERGGVLVHLREWPLTAYEHHIGLGVDEIARPDGKRPRDAVLFDFPRSSSVDAAAAFPRARLDAIRAARLGWRLIGSGPADAAIRDAFDEWIAYGVPHDEYVRHFARCRAFVPGCTESMGVAVAEAQVAGAAIVAPPGRIKAEMLTPAAAIVDDDLVRGLARAAACDGDQIAHEALAHFSPTAMAERTMAAIDAVG